MNSQYDNDDQLHGNAAEDSSQRSWKCVNGCEAPTANEQIVINEAAARPSAIESLFVIYNDF